MRQSDFRDWKEEGAHDPSLLEWRGVYYAYSTDTFGAPSGYQIRRSTDLLHWKYCGRAFDANERVRPAFDWCVTDRREGGDGICTQKDGSVSFWAPHCVRGEDGKFWLYFCLTGYFGGSKSCIGVAKSHSPEGGFRFERLLVCSPSGWRTPNAIDPQFFRGEGGRSYLIYGSFGLGLYVLELDPETGFRRDGRAYSDYERGACTFSEYYGTRVASGSLEGGAVRYHKNVEIWENGTVRKKNYYYLTCSYGSLSSDYQIRCGRSERAEGPYLDVNGNELVCSTDLGTGNKLLGSFRWENAPVDFFCPGHNDLFVTKSGVNLVAYHCRTNYFIEKRMSESNNFHYLYLAQYAFNSDGWPVINGNRYAAEEIQDVSAEQLLNITAGKFEAVAFTQKTDCVRAKRVVLHADGTLDGAFEGSWRAYGSHYVALNVLGDEYLGVAMPAWIEDQNVAGLTVSALGRKSGMALLLNSTAKI